MPKVGTEVVTRSIGFGGTGEEITPVDATHPLPVTLAAGDAESSGLATEAKQDTIIGHVDGIETAMTAANASLDAIEAKQIAGPSTAATSQSVVPSTDQNPIFDHTNGTKTAVTASATIITTGAGHTFLRITTDIDIVVNTAGATAVDDGTSARIVANVPEVIPVPPSTAIKALSLGASATVRCTPLKVR